MLSIPTDCLQCERVGWTCDMQVFAPAATFYYDTEDFYQSTLDFKGILSPAGWGDATHHGTLDSVSKIWTQGNIARKL